jgi:methylated-DNA-protein-cysteine methyltransferase related protein
MAGEPDPERAIIDAVRAIPPGFVRTYGDLWPAAPRLAGRVLANASARGLPWWRVVRADGSLAVGEEQRMRLEAEAVPFRGGEASPRVDLRIARLPPGLADVGPRRALRSRRSAS